MNTKNLPKQEMNMPMQLINYLMLPVKDIEFRKKSLMRSQNS
ncbi:hypothetical protein [Nostoc sp. ChiSLP03a]|nr:hypothetical protein [Nostoc sp. ChiSLP03a]